MRRAGLGALALVAASALGGCSGGGDAFRPVADADCSAPMPCDIAQQDCVRAVFDATACERQVSGADMPPVRHVSAAMLREALQPQLAAQSNAAQRLSDRALAALHLLAADKSPFDAALDAYVAGVAVFYDRTTGSIMIVEDHTSDDQKERMHRLSHELAHYFQDQSVGIDKLTGAVSTFDAIAAQRSLIEGDADATAWRVTSRIEGSTPARVRWPVLYDQAMETALADLTHSGSPLVQALVSVPNAVGLRYVGEVWSNYGRPDVDRLFQSAPTTVVDWLSGYGNGELAPSRFEELECDSTLDASGLELKEATRLGSVGVLAELAAAGMADIEFAGGAVGDVLAVYAQPSVSDASAADAQVFAVWRTRWQREALATQFAGAIAFSDVYVRRDGVEVTLLAGPGVDSSHPPAGADACKKIDWSGASGVLQALLQWQLVLR